MAFKLKTSLADTTPCTEYFNGKQGEVFKYGQALVLSGGTLTKCLPTTKPDFISLADVSCENASTSVPVMRVFDFYVFTCPIDGDTSSLSIGNSVSLNTDATGVSNQTANGVAQLIEITTDFVSVKF